MVKSLGPIYDGICLTTACRQRSANRGSMAIEFTEILSVVFSLCILGEMCCFFAFGVSTFEIIGQLFWYQVLFFKVLFPDSNGFMFDLMARVFCTKS